ncbi:hypothetical protein C8Q75DRAFT_374259 [Abortiporus biennis]|nr:hypothetical protein C8Q75DRAFT_374259 [Abortiporus biennis]
MHVINFILASVLLFWSSTALSAPIHSRAISPGETVQLTARHAFCDDVSKPECHSRDSFSTIVFRSEHDHANDHLQLFPRSTSHLVKREPKSIFTKIKEGFKKFGQKVKKGFQNFGKKVKKGFQNFGKKVKKGFQNFGKKVKKGFQKAWGTIKKVGGIVLNVASSVGGFLNPVKIATTAVKAVKGVVSIVRDAKKKH